eukprot:gene10420-16056_t
MHDIPPVVRHLATSVVGSACAHELGLPSCGGKSGAAAAAAGARAEYYDEGGGTVEGAFVVAAGASRLGLRVAGTGRIVQVDASSRAEHAGLRKGMVVKSVNDVSVSAEEYSRYKLDTYLTDQSCPSAGPLFLVASSRVPAGVAIRVVSSSRSLRLAVPLLRGCRGEGWPVYHAAGEATVRREGGCWVLEVGPRALAEFVEAVDDGAARADIATGLLPLRARGCPGGGGPMLPHQCGWEVAEGPWTRRCRVVVSPLARNHDNNNSSNGNNNNKTNRNDSKKNTTNKNSGDIKNDNKSNNTNNKNNSNASNDNNSGNRNNRNQNNNNDVTNSNDNKNSNKNNDNSSSNNNSNIITNSDTSKHDDARGLPAVVGGPASEKRAPPAPRPPEAPAFPSAAARGRRPNTHHGARESPPDFPPPPRRHASAAAARRARSPPPPPSHPPTRLLRTAEFLPRFERARAASERRKAQTAGAGGPSKPNPPPRVKTLGPAAVQAPLAHSRRGSQGTIPTAGASRHAAAAGKQPRGGWTWSAADVASSVAAVRGLLWQRRVARHVRSRALFRGLRTLARTAERALRVRVFAAWVGRGEYGAARTARLKQLAKIAVPPGLRLQYYSRWKLWYGLRASYRTVTLSRYWRALHRKAALARVRRVRTLRRRCVDDLLGSTLRGLYASRYRTWLVFVVVTAEARARRHIAELQAALSSLHRLYTGVSSVAHPSKLHLQLTTFIRRDSLFAGSDAAASPARRPLSGTDVVLMDLNHEMLEKVRSAWRMLRYVHALSAWVDGCTAVLRAYYRKWHLWMALVDQRRIGEGTREREARARLLRIRLHYISRIQRDNVQHALRSYYDRLHSFCFSHRKIFKGCAKPNAYCACHGVPSMSCPEKSRQRQPLAFAGLRAVR